MLSFFRKIMIDPFRISYVRQFSTLIQCVAARRFAMLLGGATCPARFALDLSGLAPGSKVKVLFHYTSKLGAVNITNASAKQAGGVCSSLSRSLI